MPCLAENWQASVLAVLMSDDVKLHCLAFSNAPKLLLTELRRLEHYLH